MRASIIVVAVACAATVIPGATPLLRAESANAHSIGGALYGARWTPYFCGVQFWFTTSVPDNGSRDRVRNGIQQWNGQNQCMTWVEGAVHADYEPNSCPGFAINGVHERNLTASYGYGASTVAATFVCTSGSSIQSANYAIDTAEAWWLQSGAPLSNYLDLWGVSTHEFGHAGGFSGHWNEGLDGSLCPSGTGWHVMCQGMPYGVTWQRTLKTHDQDTFNNAY